MPTHTEQQILPYTTQQLFDLVADIERYPEFLPWCRAARILNKSPLPLAGLILSPLPLVGEGQGEGPSQIQAELVVSFSHLTERYTSRVTLTRPKSADDAGEIDVTMVEGPFDHLVNHWRFTPESGGTRIDFFLDFKFRSWMLEKLIGSLFGKATNKMVSAFHERADALYGQPK